MSTEGVIAAYIGLIPFGPDEMHRIGRGPSNRIPRQRDLLRIHKPGIAGFRNRIIEMFPPPFIAMRHLPIVIA